MLNWLTKSALAAMTLSAVILVACNKDEVQTTLTPSNAPTLKASTSSVALTQANAANTAVTFTWTPISSFTWTNAANTYTPSVSYQFQIDKKGNNFAAPATIDATSSSPTSINVSDLDAALLGLGNPAGKAADYEVRLLANYASNAPVYSATVPLSATTYNVCVQPTKVWGLVGPAGPGWPGGKIDYVMRYDCDTKTYVYTGPLTADQFKFRFAYHWATNLGGTGPTTPLAANGGNLAISAAGNYTVTLYNATDTTSLATSYYTIK